MVAILDLTVNIASAWLLQDTHHRGSDHSHPVLLDAGVDNAT
jgi:Co/Zn/Cd efflux system component